MAKRMDEDEVMNAVYGKLFGDLDGIESHSLFDDGEEHAVEGTAENAEPEMKGSGGVKVTIEPIMAATSEGKPDRPTTDDADEEEDKLKGISSMSPLMARLHGGR